MIADALKQNRKIASVDLVGDSIVILLYHLMFFFWVNFNLDKLTLDFFGEYREEIISMLQESLQ